MTEEQERFYLIVLSTTMDHTRIHRIFTLALALGRGESVVDQEADVARFLYYRRPAYFARQPELDLPYLRQLLSRDYDACVSFVNKLDALRQVS